MTPARRTNAYVGAADPEGRLARFWSGSRGLLCVVGPAGVGKTRAVVQLAAERACAWVEGSPPVTGLDPNGPLVVDPADALDAEGLARCVALSETRPVVLVRRTPTGHAAEQRVFVPPLPHEAGLELLRLRAAEHDAPASHLTRDGMEALVRLLDGLPLALEAAARCLDVTSADALAAQLEEGSGPMAQALRAGWCTTWSALGPQQRWDVRRLCTCRGGFELSAAAALWQVELPEAIERVRQLRHYGVLGSARAPQPRFDLPVSIAALALDGWDPAERATAWRVHAAHYAASGEPIDETGVPARWRPHPPVEELPNLEAVCDPERRSPIELALRAAIAHSLSALRGDDVERSLSLLQELVEPAQALEDGSAWELRLHLRLGFLHLTAGDAHLAASHLEQADRLVPDGAAKRTLGVLQMLTWAHWRRGAPVQALDAACRGEALARREGEGFHEVNFLGFQAMIHSEAGRFEDATRCLAAMAARADTTVERSVRDVWRDVCARQDDPPVAISPDSLGLPPRVVLTTSLGKSLTLLWLGRTREVRALAERLLSTLVEPRLARTRDALLAACDVVDGEPPLALEPFRAMLFDLETQNTPEGTCRYRVLRAGALWRSGNTAQAAQQLAYALEEAERSGQLVLRDEFRLVLAVCEAELGGGDVERLRSLAGAQPMRWYAALHAQALAMVEGTPPPQSASGLRWSHQLLRRLDRSERGEPRPEPGVVELVVGPECHWFTVGSIRADLRRKRIAQRFLAALVAVHEQTPGAPLTHEAAIEAGWPGERMLPESAAARLHTLAWQLRRLGLSGLLLTSADGYALALDVRCVRASARAAESGSRI